MKNSLSIKNPKNKFFSVIIPTMWRSDKILKMLPIYENCELVKEIIIIDNDPKLTPNLKLCSKVIYYSNGENLYVNPSWNIGYSLSNFKTILANDDIIIHNITEVLNKILNTNYDIIGIDLKSKNTDEVTIIDLPKYDKNKPLGSEFYGFGCFMYVKNYKYIPNNIKIWYGDDFLFYNSTTKGILKNCKLDYSVSDTVKHIKNTIGNNIFENDKVNFTKYKENNKNTSNLNVLVSLVNYGYEQVNYLEEVINEIKKFKKYNVKIIVNTNVNLNINGIDELNLINNLSDYQLLPLTCRKTIWDNKDNFDIFIYGENDHLFKEYHIDKHIEYSKILPKDRITGLIQYEENKDGYFYPAYHAHYEWDYESVEKYGDKIFAHFTNLHQATFILTKEQLHTIGKQFDFCDFFATSNYSKKCKVNTDIYEFTTYKKLICISEFKENLIHHLPNLYINGDKGRNKNQRSDSKRMQKSLMKLFNGIEETKINGFYLNLERRVDRKIKMEEQLKKTSHNITRFNAVDGNQLTTLNGFKGTIRNSEKKQYATFLSHLNMIKIAKDKKWNNLLIFEDDVTLCNDFDKRLDFLIKKLPNDWKIVYLGFTETDITKLQKVSDYIYKVNEVYGCFGMLINNNFYETLINILEKKNTVIDYVIKNYVQTIYNCYTFMPFLLYVNDDYSDLWNTHRQLNHIKKHFKDNINLTEKNVTFNDNNNINSSSIPIIVKTPKVLPLKNRKSIDYEKINVVLTKKTPPKMEEKPKVVNKPPLRNDLFEKKMSPRTLLAKQSIKKR